MRWYRARLAVIPVLLVALAGCGLSGSEAPQEAADTTGEVKGKVTLETWALKPKFTEYMQGVIDAFEQEYPGARVEWVDQPADGYADKVLSQAAGGTLPDVTNLPPDFALPLADQGLLLDVAKADPAVTEEYVTGGVDAYRFAGLDGVYGYPWYLNTDVNYWNAELLERYGLDPGDLPTDLDEFIAQARVMKEQSGGRVYLMSRKPMLGDLVKAGVQVMSDDGKRFTFNTPKAAALLDVYRDAFADGLLPKDVLTDTYAGNAELFVQGKVAWTTGGANYISQLEVDNPSLAPKVVPSPVEGTPPLYVQGLSVSRRSDNLPTAIALARWVTSTENQAAFAHETAVFPSTKASADDPFFSESDGTNTGDAKVIAFESLAEAEMLQPVVVDDAMGDFIDQQIALAISGEVTSKEALDAAVAKCNQLLAN